jgi:citrate lyase subunit beta-like protein
VNAVDSGLCLADLQEILSAKNLPSCICIPKLEDLDHMKWFIEKTNTILKDRKDLKERLDLIFFVESANALLKLKDITEGSIKLCQKSHFVPAGIVFGSDDFYASIGAVRSNEATEISFARQFVVTVAKAYHLQAIDVVYIDFKDQKGLIKQAMEGARMGYTGKQVIHPVQISICHEAFSPSAQQIEWAQELVKGYRKHQESGKGAFVFRECMIDRPVLLQAENILAVADFLSKPTEEIIIEEETQTPEKK